MNENKSLPNNLCKYAVSSCQLPALGHFMHDFLPNEPYDPHFFGQHVHTTYFDTEKLALRSARKQGEKYATVRIREYPNETCMLQIKTNDEKIRVECPSTAMALANGFTVDQLASMLSLPGAIVALLMELAGEGELMPIVTVKYNRYAIESLSQRITLDVDVHTDTGKCLPFHVLEIKGREDADEPRIMEALGLRPIKLSKFLWATKP